MASGSRGSSVSKSDKEKADKGDKSKANKNDLCIRCSVVVKEGERAMQCEICESWYHAKCEDIRDEGYKVLQMENIHWYCISCNKGVGRVINTLLAVQHRQDKLEREWKELQTSTKQQHNKMEKELDSLRVEVEKQRHDMSCLTEELKEMNVTIQHQQQEQQKMTEEDSLWSTIVKKQVEKNIENVTGEMHEVQKTIIEAKMKMEEDKEKEKRKNNIIIYRHKESTASGSEARKKEDTEFCLNLVSDVLEIDCSSNEILNVIRLGKRASNQDRPLLVTFKETSLKNKVMESLRKLSEADEQYRALSVSHDMTQKEREECRLLVEQAKSKQQEDTSGEWIYRVRGMPGDMRIVKLRKQSRAEAGDSSDG
jgi:PHD-finger